MLSLAPKACRPRDKFADTLKMFQPEFRKQDLRFGFTVDPSYADLGMDWVMADMARTGQVLGNLISNAIKFTAHAEGERRITVMLGASAERPTTYPAGVVSFASDGPTPNMDSTDGSEWGGGDAMYLMVAVKDTGIGISDEGQKQLFERFLYVLVPFHCDLCPVPWAPPLHAAQTLWSLGQATAKTSDQYGGSGLGLNISRKLCDLHGGAIGVSSRGGEGSTFAFYFKVRRTESGGDFEGRPEQQTVEHDELQSLIQEHGHAADNITHERRTPDTAHAPPGEDASAATTPDRDEEGDHRYGSPTRQAEDVAAPEAASPNRGEMPVRDSRVRHGGHQEQRGRETSKSPARPGMVQGDVTGRPIDRDRTRDRPSARQRHVLLVEDNAINQRIVQRKLQAKGYRVTIANNGQEAVEAVRKAPKSAGGEQGGFDIILMDQEMPIMDGDAATRAIGEMVRRGEAARVPILGVTGHVREGGEQPAAVPPGMDGVIGKPFKTEELIRKMDEILAREADRSRHI
ncbi:hypothetical protein LTR53_016749 [Teratosphaeriaceae sp. CCFEE 6253]|nr:hypothetical protein LTR53_016749 [Teratosphaeriaceae sp. CCFEE 6253]